MLEFLLKLVVAPWCKSYMRSIEARHRDYHFLLILLTRFFYYSKFSVLAGSRSMSSQSFAASSLSLGGALTPRNTLLLGPVFNVGSN